MQVEIREYGVYRFSPFFRIGIHFFRCVFVFDVFKIRPQHRRKTVRARADIVDEGIDAAVSLRRLEDAVQFIGEFSGYHSALPRKHNFAVELFIAYGAQAFIFRPIRKRGFLFIGFLFYTLYCHIPTFARIIR